MKKDLNFSPKKKQVLEARKRNVFWPFKHSYFIDPEERKLDLPK